MQRIPVIVLIGAIVSLPACDEPSGGAHTTDASDQSEHHSLTQPDTNFDLSQSDSASRDRAAKQDEAPERQYQSRTLSTFEQRLRDANKRSLAVLMRPFDQAEEDRVLETAKQSTPAALTEKLDFVLESLENAGAPEDVLGDAADAGAEQVIWATKLELYGKDDPRVPPTPRLDDPRLLAMIDLMPSWTPSKTSESGTDLNTEREQRKKETQQAMMSMIMAGVCIAKPPLCPVVAILYQSMGGDSSSIQADMKMIESLGKAVDRGEIDDDLARSLGKKVGQVTDSEEKIAKLSKDLEQLKRLLESDDPTRELFKRVTEETGILNRIKDGLPGWGVQMLDLIIADAQPSEILDTFPAREVIEGKSQPFFPTPRQKRAMESAINLLAASGLDCASTVKRKYWDDLLSKVPAKD